MTSRRALQKRLDRLSATLGPESPGKDPGPFALDPAIVEALMTEMKPIASLAAREGSLRKSGNLSPAEIQQLDDLRAKFAERLQIIAPSMQGYGVTEVRRDEELFGLQFDRREPISDHERAQAELRIKFFWASPEGKGRARLSHLQDQFICCWLTPAEKTELAQLDAAYPDVPWDQSSWRGRFLGGLERAKKQSMEDERLRQKERAKTNPRYR